MDNKKEYAVEINDEHYICRGNNPIEALSDLPRLFYKARDRKNFGKGRDVPTIDELVLKTPIIITKTWK